MSETQGALVFLLPPLTQQALDAMDDQARWAYLQQTLDALEMGLAAKIDKRQSQDSGAWHDVASVVAFRRPKAK